MSPLIGFKQISVRNSEDSSVRTSKCSSKRNSKCRLSRAALAVGLLLVVGLCGCKSTSGAEDRTGANLGATQAAVDTATESAVTSSGDSTTGSVTSSAAGAVASQSSIKRGVAAVNSGRPRSAIEIELTRTLQKTCVETSTLKKTSKTELEDICSCIVRNHGELSEKDLRSLLRSYRTGTKELVALNSDEDMLFVFDMDMADRCVSDTHYSFVDEELGDESEVPSN